MVHSVLVLVHIDSYWTLHSQNVSDTEDFIIYLQIVSKDLSDPVRSHKDLDKDAAPFFKKAVKFYESLAKQLVSQGHVLDLFASALDQVSAHTNFLKFFKLFHLIVGYRMYV